MTDRRVTCALLASLLGGCGLQLGAGTRTAGSDDRVPIVITPAAQAHGVRKVSPLVTTHGTIVIEDEERPAHFRNAVLGMGVHLPPARPFPLGFGADFALEAGIGEPAFHELDGPGAYTGLAGTLLYRIWGNRDMAVSYDVLMRHVDIALTARGGPWSPPEGSGQPVYWEFGFDLGLRLTFQSDLLSASSGDVVR